jgi:serine/threonine protein kinase
VGVYGGSNDDPPAALGWRLLLKTLDARLPEAIFARRQPPRARDPREQRRDVPPPSPLVRSEPPPAGLLAMGSILDKYRIEELIGTGGFGAVYRATHLVLRTSVAIKHVLPNIVARRPELVAQLIEEARVAATIQHPNVVRIIDATKSPRLTYIVMELIEGPTLARAIKTRGRFERDAVVGLGIDVAQGLEAGLSSGIVHRDVKPSNIVLAKDGHAKIVDLGLARAAHMSRGTLGARSVVGTRGYIAPELYVDPARADFRADIYSLGVTLTEALRGRMGESEQTPLPRAEHRLAMVLRRMTANDPAERMGSYGEVIDALSRARARRGHHSVRREK